MTRPDRDKSYAVLIGVSTYQDPLWDAVPGAPNNIAALRDLLTGVDGCIAPENCILVSDPSSPTEILRKVLEVGAQATDLFLLYYVGHGFPDAARHLYLTDSGTAHEPRLREASALEWDRVRAAVRDEVTAQRKLVVIDSCHSGLAVGHLGADAPLLDIEGTFVLASTLGTDTVPGGEPFTRFTGELIDLLRTGVADDSRYLTPWMIYEELRHRLRHSRLRIPPPLNTGTVGELALLPNRRYKPAAELTPLDQLRRWWHTRQPSPPASRSARPPTRPAPPTPAKPPSRLGEPTPLTAERTEPKSAELPPATTWAIVSILVVGGVIALIAIFNSAETVYVNTLEKRGDAPLSTDKTLSYELRADTPNISTTFLLPTGMTYRNISAVGPIVTLKAAGPDVTSHGTTRFLKERCRKVEFDLTLSIDGTPQYEATFTNHTSGAARLTANTLPNLDPVNLDVPGTSRELQLTAHATLDPDCALALSLGSLKVVDGNTEWIVHFVS